MYSRENQHSLWINSEHSKHICSFFIIKEGFTLNKAQFLLPSLGNEIQSTDLDVVTLNLKFERLL